MAQLPSPSPSPGSAHGTVRHTRGWALAWAAVAVGLIAGFFYAYACSVMVGLARVEDRTFIEAMQWINATVRNRWFAPGFFGALALTALAVIVHLPRGGRRVLPWAVAALVLYAAAFGVTLGVSVPLNEDLAAVGDPALLDDPAAVRAAFEERWVGWNITRAVAATAALACLLRALVLHGRASGPRPPVPAGAEAV
ncbi:DUF1772 domain-containing protein [Nocardiopsis sp. NPDC050513]|uniref:DUF1772 domain-containing protein n=1 Tax=Nocardiopsis sp. NPDC050513 TaxID=3364338 RepID=UPI00378C5674